MSCENPCIYNWPLKRKKEKEPLYIWDCHKHQCSISPRQQPSWPFLPVNTEYTGCSRCNMLLPDKDTAKFIDFNEFWCAGWQRNFCTLLLYPVCDSCICCTKYELNLVFNTYSITHFTPTWTFHFKQLEFWNSAFPLLPG